MGLSTDIENLSKAVKELKEDARSPDYQSNIIKAFKDICQITGEGASPIEVVSLLQKRKQVAKYDTVIDITDIMKDLRNRGEL